MKVKPRRGIASRIAIVIALGALLLASLFAAFEYAQVANLQSQNGTLSSIATSYSSEAANYSSSVVELHSVNGANNSANVMGALLSHLTKLENLDTNGALQDYAPNATMTVSGYVLGASGLPGTFVGANEIKSPLDYFFGNTSSYQNYLHTQSAHIVVESFNATSKPEGNATIQAHLALTGESREWGAFNMTISASYQFIYQNHWWWISQEDWNVTYFTVEYPVTAQ